ncbi:late competence development ComFB family protein [Lachnospiraceae bacterium 46-61]
MNKPNNPLNQNTTEENKKLENPKAPDTTSIEIQRPDDTSHISEIIKEKLIEALEPTEIITKPIPPKNSFIPFEETDENTIILEHEIEPEEMTFDEEEFYQELNKQNTPQNDFEVILKNNNKKITLDSEEYIYMNVMETFVKEVIVDYMKQYAPCLCNHCIIDTMALALTNLPPKYIVVQKGSLSPLLHMYRQKYSAQISAEVLKACLAVAKFPHHIKQK